MDTTVRRASPARRARFLILAALLAAVSLAGTLPAPAAAQSGPNDTLTNEQLVAQAVSNMQGLASYHFEFRGESYAQGDAERESLTIAANLQGNANGSRVTMRYAPGVARDETQSTLSIGQYIAPATEVRFTDAEWRESYDGGKTWSRPETDTPAAYLMVGVVCVWRGHCWQPGATSAGSSIISRGLANPVIADGSPRTQAVDGVPTRHLVGEFSEAAGFPKGTPVELWISTDAAPMIRQIRTERAGEVPGETTGPAQALAFSPDGKTLAVAHKDAADQSVRFWDLTQPGNAPVKLTGSQGGFGSVVFTPDGKEVFAAEPFDPGGLYTFAMDDPPRLSTVQWPRAVIHALAVRTDGQQMAAATAEGVFLWDLSAALPREVQVPGSGSQSYNGVAYSPDGRTLAASASEGVWLFDLNQPYATPTLLRHLGARAPAFSPDGDWLAAIGAEGNTVRLWDRRTTPPAATVLPGVADDGAALAFSPDSHLLAASGTPGTLRLWNLGRPGTDPTLISAGAEPVSGLAFSPDGATLAAASLDGAVRLWNVADLRQSASAAVQPTILRSPDRGAIPTTATLTWNWSRFN
ncbi:MAG TPA: hypothetical protein VF276_09180 [Chloroflexia bacterium]